MRHSTQDGVFAWLVCAAGCLTLMITGGFNQCSGIFFIMFKDSITAQVSEIAMAISMNGAIPRMIAPLAGKLIEVFGHRTISALGCLLSTIGVACSAFATKPIHLYISYGIITGIGHGLLMMPAITIINPYFKIHKRVAAGFVWCGSAMGSLFTPIIVKVLEDAYGWRGAMLLMAGINAQAFVLGMAFRPFTSSQEIANGCKSSSQENKPVNRWSRLRDALKETLLLLKIMPFSSMLIATAIGLIPVSLIAAHFGNYALTIGYTRNDVVNLYVVYGISNTITRPLTGILAQLTKANLLLILLLSFVANGILTTLLPFAREIWLMFGYAALYQIFMGPFNVLGSAIVMEHVPGEHVPMAFGLTLLSCVPGYFLGPPVAAWIYESNREYYMSFLLSGGLLILCGLSLAPASYYRYTRKQRLTQ